MSSKRGGGGRRSDRGGRGAGRGGRASSASSSSAAFSSRPIDTATAPQPSSAAAAPPPPSPASTSAATLSGDLEKKLTVSAPAPSQLPPSSSKAITHPPRPGLGTVGRKIMVRANHFLVEVADRDLYHYDVLITPEVTSKKVNREVISQLVCMYGDSHLGQKKPAYDGRKSLYTAGPFPFESKEFVVKLSAGSAASASKERQFKITLKLASRPDLHHLQQFLRQRQRDAPQETIQVLDVVLRMEPAEKFVTVGRSFFSPSFTRGVLGDGVEYWGGFYQSLRLTQMGLSLNIDISARSFYEPILVTEFLSKYLNIRDLSRPLSDQDRVKVKKALKSLRVELAQWNYARSYKVTGVSNCPIRQLTFTLDDKRTSMSVVKYFLEKHNITLKYTSLPALQAGSDSKPVFLPMELCRIAEGQRYTKKLNERQVTALLRATCQRPEARENAIKQMVKDNDYSKNKLVADEFGIQVRKELIVVDARVLPPPMIKYHDSGREATVNPGLGQWNMIDKKMVNGGKVEYWASVCFSQRLDRNMHNEFCKQLIGMCNSKGMDFNPRPLIPLFASHPSEIEKALMDINKECTARLQRNRNQLQLLIVILPDVSGSYGKIKRICETELGIVSQCCQPRQASKLSKQYMENVALKINVKVGGRNSVLNDAIHRRLPGVSDRPTIIIGADVTHPPPGEDSSPSIAAVVASMDWPEVTKYRGICSAQNHRQEIIEDLYKTIQDPQRGLIHSGMIRELFIAFRRSTGQKPHRIIFYRDGVSEGQFNQVLLYEMDAIRKACVSLEAGYLPPVTFVVVQKRHHTRLFPAVHGDRKLTDRSGNILPGTVVDTKICHPTEFDFYLNSHAGIQGTSRPAHYHVLFDENNFTADALQMLTNSLCYTYARCTRSVSVVPPAYYAHLAAFRARCYVEGEMSDGGSTAGRSRDPTQEVRSLPDIKDNVKDVMFYC